MKHMNHPYHHILKKHRLILLMLPLLIFSYSCDSKRSTSDLGKMQKRNSRLKAETVATKKAEKNLSIKKTATATVKANLTSKKTISIPKKDSSHSKKNYTTTTLLRFKTLTKGRPYRWIKVAGWNRPKMVLILFEDLHHELFFLDEKMRVKSKRILRGQNPVFAKSGKAILLSPSSKARAELIDANGETRWYTNYISVLRRHGTHKYLLGGTAKNVFVTPDLQRTIVAHWAMSYAIIVLFDGKGQQVGNFLLAPARLEYSAIDAVRRELAYGVRASSKKNPNGKSILIRARAHDLSVIWKKEFLGYEILSLTASKNYTVVITQKSFSNKSSTLIVFDKHGKQRWTKTVAVQGWFRLKFWPDESKLLVEGNIYDASTGKMLASQITKTYNTVPSQKFAFTGVESVLFPNGKIKRLFLTTNYTRDNPYKYKKNGKTYIRVGTHGGFGSKVWVSRCSLITSNSIGIHRLISPQVKSLLNCSE